MRVSATDQSHQQKPPTAIIIASTIHDAITTAEIDWKWKRISTGAHLTHKGERAQVATRGEQIRGFPDRTVIYKTRRWYLWSSEDLELLRILLATGRLIESSVE